MQERRVRSGSQVSEVRRTSRVPTRNGPRTRRRAGCRCGCRVRGGSRSPRSRGRPALPCDAGSGAAWPTQEKVKRVVGRPLCTDATRSYKRARCVRDLIICRSSYSACDAHPRQPCARPPYIHTCKCCASRYNRYGRPRQTSRATDPVHMRSRNIIIALCCSGIGGPSEVGRRVGD